MPEGDTIHRTAEVLRAVLVGRTISAARAQPRPGLRRVPDLRRLVGTRAKSVEARGKHVLIGFENGMILRTHMRMAGSWHRYRPGEPWRRPANEATVVLETPDSVAVCFNAPVAELLTDAELGRHRPLATLGPDLLAPNFDDDAAVRRLRERAQMGLGEALLDQRAVAGIGNVYKSEACFVARLDPWAPVAQFERAEIQTVVLTARELMSANLRAGARSTTGHRAGRGNLWVYGRAGRPCRRCGTLIRSAPQGEQLRLTYWCPRCQPARGATQP